MERSRMASQEYQDFSLRAHTQAARQNKVVNAQIELTYGCNLHCVHCYTDCYNQPDLIRERELPYPEVIRILDELHDEGILWVCFTGGEILVRKDFFDIYLYAREKGFLITLFTNATLITRRIADFLAAHRPFVIETSLHGATSRTFDQITQVKGSFERFKEGLQLLLERHLPVKVKTKAMTFNRDELDLIKDLVEGLGLEFQVSTEIYPRLDGDLTSTDYRLSPREIVELEFSEKVSLDDSTCRAEKDADSGPPSDDRLFRCGCGTTGVHVNAWGGLGTCTWVQPRADLKQKSVSAGISEIFPHIRGARYQSDSPCRDCRIPTLCDKMVGNAAAEAKDREQPVEHFCRVAYGRAEKMGIEAECPVDL